MLDVRPCSMFDVRCSIGPSLSALRPWEGLFSVSYAAKVTGETEKRPPEPRSARGKCPSNIEHRSNTLEQAMREAAVRGEEEACARARRGAGGGWAGQGGVRGRVARAADGAPGTAPRGQAGHPRPPPQRRPGGGGGGTAEEEEARPSEAFREERWGALAQACAPKAAWGTPAASVQASWAYEASRDVEALGMTFGRWATKL